MYTGTETETDEEKGGTCGPCPGSGTVHVPVGRRLFFSPKGTLDGEEVSQRPVNDLVLEP